VDTRSSNATLVDSSLPQPPCRSASASITSRVTVTTFLKGDGPSGPPLANIYTPVAGLEPLPPIPYSLRTRKLAIFVVWTIVILDSVVLPTSLFFILKYGAGWPDVKSASSLQLLDSTMLLTCEPQILGSQMVSLVSSPSYNTFCGCTVF
jgi:hypothetical protein